MTERLDAVLGVDASAVHPDGIAVRLSWPLLVHPVWSLDGGGIFLLLWKVGLYRLDLDAPRLDEVGSWALRFCGRPLVSGARLMACTLRGALWFERTESGWAQVGRSESSSMTFAPEWLPPGQKTIPAVGYQDKNRDWRLRELDLSGQPIREILPVGEDGAPLDLRAEYPTWWEPGESILVTARRGEEIEPWIVDLKSGRSWALQLPGGRSLHRFSRASGAPVLAGFDREPPFNGGECGAVRLLACRIGADRVMDLGLLIPQEAFSNTVAVSPGGDRVACVDTKGLIHLIPTGL